MLNFLKRLLFSSAAPTPVPSTPSVTRPSLSKQPYVVSTGDLKLSDHQHEFGRDVVKLLGYAHSLGWKVTLGEVMRTMEQQEIYLKTGKSKTMNSMHLKKCAIDLFFFDPKAPYTPVWSKTALQKLGDYWCSLSPLNRWGGNWKSFQDTPHFERRV